MTQKNEPLITALYELLICQMAERQGVNEELKHRDQMGWVRAMNTSAIPGTRPGAGFAPLLQAIASPTSNALQGMHSRFLRDPHHGASVVFNAIEPEIVSLL